MNSPGFSISFYGETNVGLVRTNNEDAFIAQPLWEDERYTLCVAIDGLGGHAAGEVAAGIARGTIVNYLNRHRGEDGGMELLKAAVAEANNAIIDQQSVPGRSNMGCVLTAGIFDGKEGRLYVAHVGDSRLYRINGTSIDKLTHDHSLVGYREDIGELSEAQAMNHPRRNEVERILGEKPHNPDDPNFIEGQRFTVTPGERYVFCSDGLSDLVTKADITALATASESLEVCAKALIKAACDKGGKDNITVVLAQVGTWDDVRQAMRKKHENVVVTSLHDEVPPQAEPVAQQSKTVAQETFVGSALSNHNAPRGAMPTANPQQAQVQKPKPQPSNAFIATVAAAAIALTAGGFFAGKFYENARIHKSVAPQIVKCEKSIDEALKIINELDTLINPPTPDIPRNSK